MLGTTHTPCSISQEEGTLQITITRSEKKLWIRRKMWFMYVYDEEEKELGRQQAPGSCPFCDGKVEAMDVEIQWRFCFLPMCFKIKRKFFCTLCARRLELYF
ncbi:hypothetical protein RJT34_14871 [Clitoria ternatea]|uniref:Uncharacterized protein n=1 Tax=Clitoria ternatea TaxID=43366 RepID=A0AAN9JTC6_CLITE